MADNVRIEAGATLRVQGPNAFFLHAKGSFEIDGLVDLSGLDRPDVATLGTGNQPEVGAAGVAGGGFGGVGSFLTTTSTPMGGAGFGAFGQVGLGGGGGEAGYGLGPTDAFRGGGGGGGALGPDLPAQALPGLVGILPQSGYDGGQIATGAVFGLNPPQGGQRGLGAFVDGDASNDFWGLRLDPVTGVVTVGELRRPRAGSGGGAGGDSVKTSTFPPLPWSPLTDKKGNGGGGGGGLGLMKARLVRLGSAGAIRADGGDGGAGESVLFLDHVGGGSGGGSGGYLVLQGAHFDLSQASADCLSAVGGAGGEGKSGAGSMSAGGDGGAGVIQLHYLHPGALILPSGSTLAELSIPDAHQLLPIL